MVTGVCLDDIKAAVVQALHQQAEVGPLHRLMLITPQTRDDRRHSKEEFCDLWKAIFSLPQLDQLELVIAGGVCHLTLEDEESIYGIWKDATLQTRIKEMKLVKYIGVEKVEDHPLLKELTQNLLFTHKPY